MRATPDQAAAIKQANKILAQAGLPAYNLKLHPTVQLEGEASPVAINLGGLIKVSPSPFQTQWEVVGGASKWHRRIGRHVGVIEIANSRCHGVLLQFKEGEVQAFNPGDMFPWRGEQVVFDTLKE